MLVKKFLAIITCIVLKLTQRIDSLKGKLNTENVNKEIVLTSSGLVTISRTINSERWVYLRALPEKARNSS
jgi:hypothetical protein